MIHTRKSIDNQATKLWATLNSAIIAHVLLQPDKEVLFEDFSRPMIINVEAGNDGGNAFNYVWRLSVDEYGQLLVQTVIDHCVEPGDNEAEELEFLSAELGLSDMLELLEFIDAEEFEIA